MFFVVHRRLGVGAVAGVYSIGELDTGLESFVVV